MSDFDPERLAKNAAVFCISVASNPHTDRMEAATWRIQQVINSSYRAGLEEAAQIADRHDDWCWLKEAYGIEGAPTAEAHGAGLVFAAIRRKAEEVG